MRSTARRAAEVGIGEIAHEFGLAPHVLRHWEASGLLSPPRDGAGRRRYGDAERVRVAVVLRAKEAGMGLEAIRALLTRGDPATQRATLRAQRDVLRERAARTRAELELVEHALDCAHEDLTDCPRFQELVRERAGVPEPDTARLLSEL
ncbi:MerR family transcriptional regulator [Streptomyces sp. NPDC048172]|uniref:MerR family transcriptional regulator n=1 Tax=Streptomyces sp. NPDC048172 TaxID=3365505 RepID=UPI00371F9BB1